MVKAYFSEEPEKIRYITAINGYVDVWLRDDIEEVVTTNEDGEELISWQANENYFRVKQKNMSFQYVEDNFNELLNYKETKLKETTLEERIADLEEAIAMIIGGGIV